MTSPVSRALRLLAFGLLALFAVAVPPAPASESRRLEPYTLEHFEAFCARLRLINGRPFVLEEFQRAVLRDFFAGYREILWILPTGNGKTTLLAALGLYHLIFYPEGEARVFILAASKKNAQELYDHACGFVRRSKGLKKRLLLRKGSWEIRSRVDDGRMEVLPADAETIDGTGATLALIEELHRHRDGSAKGTLVKGLKKRGGQCVGISTAGDDPQSALGKLRARGLALPGVHREGPRYTVARAEDLTFAFHEYAVDDDDDLEDLETVKLANPASFITVEDLRKDKLALEAWEFARYCACRWVRGEQAAISPLDWARRGRPGLTIGGDAGIWVGIDLGWKWDTTAIVPLWMATPERAVFGVPEIVIPPRDGTSLKEAAIIEPLLELIGTRKVLGIVFDRNAGGEQLAGMLEGGEMLLDGEVKRFPPMVVIDHSQDPVPMALAAERFSAAIRNGHLEHPEDELFTDHVLSAVARKVGGGSRWRFDKRQRKPKPIDALIAAAMALSVALAPPEEEEPPDPDDYRFDFLDEDEDLDGDEDLVDDELDPMPIDKDKRA